MDAGRLGLCQRQAKSACAVVQVSCSGVHPDNPYPRILGRETMVDDLELIEIEESADPHTHPPWLEVLERPLPKIGRAHV